MKSAPQMSMCAHACTCQRISIWALYNMSALRSTVKGLDSELFVCSGSEHHHAPSRLIRPRRHTKVATLTFECWACCRLDCLLTALSIDWCCWLTSGSAASPSNNLQENSSSQIPQPATAHATPTAAICFATLSSMFVRLIPLCKAMLPGLTIDGWNLKVALASDWVAGWEKLLSCAALSMAAGLLWNETKFML